MRDALAEVGAKAIGVNVTCGGVILEGRVHIWWERDAVEGERPASDASLSSVRT